MKRVRNGLILIAALLLTQFLGAQQLSLQLAGSGFPASGVLGTSDSVQIQVINTDTVDYNGDLGFWYSINGSAQDSSAAGGADVFFPTEPGVNIPGGGNVLRTLIINFEPPRFSVGPSVVIIWPIAPPSQSVDSLIGTPTIFPFASIGNVADNGPKVYVANNNLVINDVNSEVKRVRIMGIDGRLLIDNQQETSTVLPLNNLAAGSYLAEVLYGDNKRKVLQFVTQ